MDQTRDRGLLSERDRQYLNEATAQQKRTRKGKKDAKRIRQRIYHGLRDFDVIANKLEPQERKQIFNKLPEDLKLQHGIESALAFLYHGLGDANQDFEDVLESAIQSPDQKLRQRRTARNGKRELILELDPKQFKIDREPEEYTDEEIGMFLFAGQIDGDTALNMLQARRDNTD